MSALLISRRQFAFSFGECVWEMVDQERIAMGGYQARVAVSMV